MEFIAYAVHDAGGEVQYRRFAVERADTRESPSDRCR